MSRYKGRYGAGNKAMPKARDFTKRIIPLFVIVMIGWVLVISLLMALMPG